MIFGAILIGMASGTGCALVAGVSGMGLPASLLAYPLGGMAGTVAAALVGGAMSAGSGRHGASNLSAMGASAHR